MAGEKLARARQAARMHFRSRLGDLWCARRALDATFALDLLLLSNLVAASVDADAIVVDVGPSLGALNRSALLACDHIVVPLAPDLFSLAPIAQLARKPMFDLKHADGIGGGQIQAVARCRREFRELARQIVERIGLERRAA
jgi:hypothetical protein